MGKVLANRIKLIPTDISLYVLVGDRKKFPKKLKTIFGDKKSYWKSIIGDSNEALILDNDIFIFLEELDPQVVVHETVHATWFLDELVDLGFSSESQEVQAYYVDYIFSEIMKMK